jgi:hypothetical protein
MYLMVYERLTSACSWIVFSHNRTETAGVKLLSKGMKEEDL